MTRPQWCADACICGPKNEQNPFGCLCRDIGAPASRLLHRSEAQRRAQILRLNFALPPGKAVEGVVTLNPLHVYRESASYLALGAVQENPHKQDSVAS